MTRLLVRLAVPALATAIVLAAAPLYGLLNADSKIDPRLKQELGDGSYAYSVKVELGSQPEYFHVKKLQQVGTVAGISGHTVRVLQLTPDEVHEIASFYWVERVEPLDGTG